MPKSMQLFKAFGRNCEMDTHTDRQDKTLYARILLTRSISNEELDCLSLLCFFSLRTFFPVQYVEANLFSYLPLCCLR